MASKSNISNGDIKEKKERKYDTRYRPETDKNVTTISVDRSGLIGEQYRLHKAMELKAQLQDLQRRRKSIEGVNIQSGRKISLPHTIGANEQDMIMQYVEREAMTPLAKHLRALIDVRGPITVSQFMQEILTNPRDGYYMHKDVFGSKGDFITAPEISQVVGELIGIWTICQWEKMGRPSNFRLIEIGPGRGTLMADLLRGTNVFKQFRNSLKEIALVEVSEAMRKMQAEKFGCNLKDIKKRPKTPSKLKGELPDDGFDYHVKSKDINGLQFVWHNETSSVPDDLHEVVIMHEFLDALPVHQFVRESSGSRIRNSHKSKEKLEYDDSCINDTAINKQSWRERMITVNDGDEYSPYHFRFVMSPGPTPASYTVLERRLQIMRDSKLAASLNAIEVCPRAIALAEYLAIRASKTGGAALVIDYGKNEPLETSLRAIKSHSISHPLESPGHADLSCSVDFSSLSDAVSKKRQDDQAEVMSSAYGPITQCSFFHTLGIVERMEQLGNNAQTEDEREQIRSAYFRLVGSNEKLGEGENEGDSDRKENQEGMGTSYMCFAITADSIGRPIGF